MDQKQIQERMEEVSILAGTACGLAALALERKRLSRKAMEHSAQALEKSAKIIREVLDS